MGGDGGGGGGGDRGQFVTTTDTAAMLSGNLTLQQATPLRPEYFRAKERAVELLRHVFSAPLHWSRSRGERGWHGCRSCYVLHTVMTTYSETVYMAVDNEELVTCPFNSSHKLSRLRFPYHLVRCRKNYPLLAMEMATCPFSACHVMPKLDLMMHVSLCPERGYVDRQLSHDMKVSKGNVPRLPLPPCNSSQIECTEDWDLETDSLSKQDGVFTWGVGYVKKEIDDVDYNNIPGNLSTTAKKQFKKQLGSATASDCSMINIRIPRELPAVLTEWSQGRGRGRGPQSVEPRETPVMNIRMPRELPDVLAEWSKGRGRGRGAQSVGPKKKQILLATRFNDLPDGIEARISTAVDASGRLHADPGVGTRVSAGGTTPPLQK